jgi:hypothetical protein
MSDQFEPNAMEFSEINKIAESAEDKAFLKLREMPGSAENFKLRGICVEYAVLHRCPGDMFL